MSEADLSAAVTQLSSTYAPQSQTKDSSLRQTTPGSSTSPIPIDLPPIAGAVGPQQASRVSAVSLASAEWTGGVCNTESTFHQLSPYIGKSKSSMAAALVREFTLSGHTLYEPFSGCGSIAFESWVAGCNVIANDLSPYARLLTRAKLFPYGSLELALDDLHRSAKAVRKEARPDLRSVPQWVREFFHPDTLREILIWTSVLRRRRHWFLLACLMGILHHQRPGFLSFPSSHSVPYLRLRKFPRDQFPEMYKYRSLVDRLERKVSRAFRRVPELDFDLRRSCYSQDAARFRPGPVDVILTSPPYMRQLDYGRDNRLRLWFLGCRDCDALDESVSPAESDFLALMRACFRRWKDLLSSEGNCVLVMGDACSRENRSALPDAVTQLARESGFVFADHRTDVIPSDRRVRQGITGSLSETILVLRKGGAAR